jgi:hypothetical protein
MQVTNERNDPRPGLVRPGPIGLLIRVVLGAASMYALVELVTKWDIFRDQNLIESDFWFITLFTLCLLPDVFNIGLRRRWGARPVVVFLAGGAAIAAVGYMASREIWTTALAAWVYAGDLVVFAALVVSFPLAIAMRTPGLRVQRHAEAPRSTAWHAGWGDAALHPRRGPARQAPDAPAGPPSRSASTSTKGDQRSRPRMRHAISS